MDRKDHGFLLQMIYGSHLDGADGNAECGDLKFLN